MLCSVGTSMELLRRRFERGDLVILTYSSVYCCTFDSETQNFIYVSKPENRWERDFLRGLSCGIVISDPICRKDIIGVVEKHGERSDDSLPNFSMVLADGRIYAVYVDFLRLA